MRAWRDSTLRRVGELGDLLELIVGAHRAWRTVRLRAREWTHRGRERDALAAFSERRQPGSSAALRGVPDAVPAEWERAIELVVAAGGRYRSRRSDELEELEIAFDGAQTWTRGELGVVVHERPLGRPPGWDLLDPARLLPSVELAVRGRGEHAGRAAIAATATVRGDAAFDDLLLPPGTEEAELLVDAERGILLRAEARRNGEPIVVVEVVEVEFDVELSHEPFALAPAAGERVRSAAEAFRADLVSVDEAARRASFRVWIPSGLDARWRSQAVHRPASGRVPELVDVTFFDDALHTFLVEQAAEHWLGWRRDEAETLVRDGVTLRVFPGSQPGPPSEVQLERDGTHVCINSTSLDRGALVEIAASLVPAPTEHPRVFE